MKQKFSGLTFLLMGLLAGILLERALPRTKTRSVSAEADTPLVANIRFDDDSGSRATNGESAATAIELRETGVSGRDAAVADTPVAPVQMSRTASATSDTVPDTTVRIPRKFLANLNCLVIDVRSNAVADEIVELLGITPDERVRLNEGIAATRARVEDHEIERAAVLEQSPTRVVLKIAADAEKGSALEKQFDDGVREALGDRADLFLEQMRRYQNSTFGNFGRYDTTLTVTRDPSTAMLRVESRQEYTIPGGGHGAMSSSSISDKMPDRWNKFFQPQ